MINYYKILGLENYASIKEIRTAYIKKIREYHPDVNDSEHALEISKMLNLAKSSLDNEEKKAIYDQKLQMAYAVEIDRLQGKQANRAARRMHMFEQRRKREEAQKLKELNKYESGLVTFPLRIRWVILSLVFLWAITIYHRNFFFTFEGIEPLILTLALFAMLGCVAIGVNEMYKHYYFKAMKEPVTINYEKLGYKIMTMGLPLLFLITYALFSLQKQYWLKSNYEYHQAEIVIDKSHFLQSFVYCFNIDGHTYCMEENVEHLSRGEYRSIARARTITIKYAVPNPSVSEIDFEVNLNQFYDPQLELRN